MAAPQPMALRFTTLVMAMRPTFWLKEVIGRHPKREDRELMNPSTAMAPETSRFFGARPKPIVASALVSPNVSVADTRKIRKKEKIASPRNSSSTGMTPGSARSGTSVM